MAPWGPKGPEGHRRALFVTKPLGRKNGWSFCYCTEAVAGPCVLGIVLMSGTWHSEALGARPLDSKVCGLGIAVMLRCSSESPATKACRVLYVLRDAAMTRRRLSHTHSPCRRKPKQFGLDPMLCRKHCPDETHLLSASPSVPCASVPPQCPVLKCRAEVRFPRADRAIAAFSLV